MTRHAKIVTLLSISTVAALAGCSASDPIASPPASGGANGTSSELGGRSNASSSTPAAAGGTLSAGGAFASGGIGDTANGGFNAGGTVVNGGAPAGGATVVKGGSGSGGNAATAGGTASASGGKAAGTGGTSIGSGGKAAGTGGTSIGSGGKATGGGTPGSGGAITAAGGAASPGSCVESNCGSHKWACWKVPTPPSENLPNPQSYTDLGNGAVRDNVTCLVWEKANPATQGNWQASVDRCASLGSSNYAGFSDWRMPTRMEMASLVDPTRGGKAFNAIFTVTSGYYGTGSWWMETITGQSTSGFHWGYGANGFTSNAVAMGGSNIVARCVRGNGAGEAANELAKEPPSHYAINSGEVTDNYTGLVWQQGFSPSLLAWADAPAYCASLTLNGHTGFRVPTLGEMSSTVNEAKVGGAIVTSAFPGNPVGCKDPKYWFWVAEAYGTANHWGLSYCDGFTGFNSGASGDWNYFPTANVRCVRNGP